MFPTVSLALIPGWLQYQGLAKSKLIFQWNEILALRNNVKGHDVKDGLKGREVVYKSELHYKLTFLAQLENHMPRKSRCLVLSFLGGTMLDASNVYSYC